MRSQARRNGFLICTCRSLAVFFGVIVLSWAHGVWAEELERRSQRGPVEVFVRLEPAEPVIGDPIHLEIEVLAEEGVEVLMPEFGDALDRFLILDFAPKDGLAQDGRVRRVQSYTLQPPMSGSHSVPNLLVEFVDRRPGMKPAPDGADAHELLTERIDFEVASVLPEGALSELRPMPGKLSPLGGRVISPWLAILILVVLAIVVGPFAYRRWASHQEARRRQTAYEIATSALSNLLAGGQRPRQDKLEKFYVELSGIIRRYLESRFNLRSPELTTEEFLAVASRSPDLTAPMREMLGEFLRQADLVKFAGFQPGTEQIDESVESARRFLEQTRTAGDAPAHVDTGEGPR